MNADDPTSSATPPPQPEALPHDVASRLKRAAEEIVKRGKDVRTEISRLVSEASASLQHGKDGLISLTKAVAEGAASGAKQTMPEDADSLLRPVVSGLSDGFTKVAQAVKFATQESGSKGKEFAKEDLDKVAKDLRGVGDGFVTTVQQAVGSVSGHVTDQAKSLLGHAKNALKDMQPALDAAIASAKQDPVKLGKETVMAGASAARQAAGVLFSEIGAIMQSAGQKLKH